MVRFGYRRTVSSALIPLALLIATLFGTIAASAKTAGATGLSVTPSVAFGNVAFGVTGATSAAKSVKITNPLTGQPVTGLSVQITGADATEFTISNNGCASTLAKGTYCTVMLTFTPAALGTRHASLAVSDSANANAGSAALSGVGIAGKLTFTPLTLSFGSIVVAATSTSKSTTVKNTTGATLHIVSAAPSGEFSITSDTCSGNNLAPAATCTIGASFSPNQTGPLSGDLTITDDASGSPQLVTLGGSGILAKPTFSSPSISFGRVRVGTTSEPTIITLFNPNVLALQITSITTSGPFAANSAACGLQIAAGGSCQISITFDPTIDPTQTGTLETGKLNVADNATGSPQTVTLSGTAFGTAPSYTPTATATATATATPTATATATPTVSVTGQAIQNGMNGASITAASVNPDGSDGSSLGTAKADTNGNFSMVIAPPQSGPVRFRASGGSYVSEQDRTTISSPSPLSALLPSLQSNLSSLSINPLTTFEDSLAQGNILLKGQPLLIALGNSTSSIEQDYGISTDPSTLTPLYTPDAVGTDAGRLALTLGAIVNEDELSCPSAPGGLVSALTSDLSDGVFDGTILGTPVSYCGGNLATIAGTAQFSDALSGLQQLTLATSGFTFGGALNELSLNGVSAADVEGDAATIESALVGAAPPSVDTFAATTPVMNAARQGATATLLPNGKVLIAGGGGGPGVGPLSSTELYDPASNTFAASTPSMNTARILATATLLRNGKVLIAGGEDSVGNPFSSTELYDPASNTFAASTPSMNTARYQATATLLSNGQVLIAGGEDNAGNPLSSTDLYDPASNTFAASTPSMNTARYAATATLLPNGEVLIVGGLDSSSNHSTSTELYNPVNNTFAASTPVMNVGRAFATATLLPNGQVLIAGGVGSNFLRSTELYDPVSNTFAATTPVMNTARLQAAATLLPNGKVLIAGGHNSNRLSSTELYDPASNTFAASTPSMNTARFQVTATLLSNGKVLIAGGSGGIGVGSLSSTELYTP